MDKVSLGLDFDGDSIGIVDLMRVGFKTDLIRVTYEIESGEEYEDIVPLLKGVDDIDSYVSAHISNIGCKVMQYSYEILDKAEAELISSSLSKTDTLAEAFQTHNNMMSIEQQLVSPSRVVIQSLHQLRDVYGDHIDEIVRKD